MHAKQDDQPLLPVNFIWFPPQLDILMTLN